MAINLDKPHLWKEDTRASVDHYNKWFMKFAPQAFRETRVEVTKRVEQAILDSNDLRNLSADLLLSKPGILPTLRMSCCPPLAVDRLIGLAYSSKNLVGNMEEGKLAVKMKQPDVIAHLNRIVKVISKLLDPDIFVWIPEGRKPTRTERHRASTIVADRFCHGVAVNGIIRVDHKRDLLRDLAAFLRSCGYWEHRICTNKKSKASTPGAFSFPATLPLAIGSRDRASFDLLIHAMSRRPIVLDVRTSVSSNANTGMCRQIASKLRELHMNYRDSVRYVLVLAGTFNAGDLGTLAAEGIDWIWQHRMRDLARVLRN
jgi:hypothetical protein